MNILICEDNDVERKVIELAVAGDSVSVVSVRDGRKGIEMLSTEKHFDLIITDIHMPYHNGDEILSLVRDKQKKNTPIVMISSDGDEEVVRLALKLGVNDFIKKPLDISEVKKKLRKYLPSSR